MHLTMGETVGSGVYLKIHQQIIIRTFRIKCFQVISVSRELIKFCTIADLNSWNFPLL
jgi:hypothetical protein